MLKRTELRISAIPLWLLMVFALCLALQSLDVVVDQLAHLRKFDFTSFYAMGEMARYHPRDVYNRVLHMNFEHRIMGPGSEDYYNCFNYPPILLPVLALVSLVPYAPAFFIWTVCQMSLFLALLRKAVAPTKLFWLILVFPGVYYGIKLGQNALLTGSIFLGIYLALKSNRPALLGVLLALLIYKPQFALMSPLMVLLQKDWKTVAAYAGTALALFVIPCLVVGSDVWLQYFESFVRYGASSYGGTGESNFHLAPYLRHVRSDVIISWLGLVMTGGGSRELAYAVQLIALIGAAGVMAVRSSGQPPAGRMALFVGCTFLAAPMGLLYDFATVVIFMALAGDLEERGAIRTAYKYLLVAIYVTSATTFEVFDIQAGIFFVLAFVIMVATGGRETGSKDSRKIKPSETEFAQGMPQ